MHDMKVLLLLVITYCAVHALDLSVNGLHIPRPPTSNSSAYARVSDSLRALSNTSRSPCESFYEYTCDKATVVGGFTSERTADIVRQVSDAVDNGRDMQLLPLAQFKQLTDACVRRMLNFTSVIDPTKVVEIVQKFAKKSEFPFPLLDGSTSVGWPNATALAGALAYLSRDLQLNPLLGATVQTNYGGDSGSHPYMLFVGGSLPSMNRRALQLQRQDVDTRDIADILNRYARLVGRTIPTESLEKEANEIKLLARTIANYSESSDEMNDLMSAYNSFTVNEANSLFGAFINFTKYVSVLTEASSNSTREFATGPFFQFAITSPDFIYKLAGLFAGKSHHRFHPSTLYNYIFFTVVSKYEELFLEPQETKRMELGELIEFGRRHPREDKSLLLTSQRRTIVVPKNDSRRAMLEACVYNFMGSALHYAADRILIDASLPTAEARNRLFDGVGRMVDGITVALESMITQVDWMTEQTKVRAIEKLHKMYKGIGCSPIVVDDKRLVEHYRGLSFNDSADNHALMAQELLRYAFQSELEKLALNDTSPADLFEMPATEVNAQNLFAYNAINIPLGYMQYPIFDVEWPESMKYGSLGRAIGHEMTHGFDPTGINYDAEGRLRPWVDVESQVAFDQMTQCLIEQYSRFCSKNGNKSTCLNGDGTKSENMADNGGLRAAYRAYRSVVQLQGPDAQLPGNLTRFYEQDQLFFMAFGRWYCENHTSASIITTDPHSPSKYRVKGPLQNFRAFADAFNCPVGSTYVPKDACEVWVTKPPLAANKPN